MPLAKGALLGDRRRTPLGISGDEHPHRFELDRKMVLELAAPGPAGEPELGERRADLGERPSRLGPEVVRRVAGSPRSCRRRRTAPGTRRPRRRRSVAALAARSESHAAAMVCATSPVAPGFVARQRRGRGDRREERGVRRVGVQPREQRVEVGPRLVLGLEAVMQDGPSGSDIADVDAALVLHEIDDTAVGAHPEPVERAGRGEHRVPGELRQHVRDHLLGAERLAARRCT